MPADSNDILSVKPKLDSRGFDRDINKSSKNAALQTGKITKAYKLFGKATEFITRRLVPAQKKSRHEIEANEKASKRLYQTSVKHAEEFLEVQRRLRDASQDERVEIQKQIKALEEKYLVSITGAKGYVKQLQMAKVAAGKLRKEEMEAQEERFMKVVGYGKEEAGEDIADGFVSALGSISGKDLGGFARGFAKSLSSVGKFGAGAGMRMAAKGAEMGGMGGGAMKAVGGLMKSVGPMLNMLAKMGPLLGAVSSSIMAIVKLFLDAEAAAKDFNKEILATAGTGGFLGRNMGNAKAAASDLQATLKSAYDQATSLDNLGWGISKETHSAVISSLTAEGVTIDGLADTFKKMSDGTVKSAGYVKDWGSMVQMSVAYSRTFGVSLNELTQFQGEMMTELGASFDVVETQFDAIRKGAEQSGMGANKFFGILRSVSSDLALYNTRMEDATHLLTLLGKVMSPRNASKFMQTATQALHGMGRIDRLKLNLLGGGKMAGLVTRDLGRKAGSLAKQIASSGGSSGVSPADILDSSKNIEDILQGVSKEQQGTFREAITEMRMDTKMNKKGVYGASLAGKNLGPGAALQAMKDALKPFAGGAKSLMEMRGSIGPEQMAENLGINEDQLASMVKFESAIDDQRDLLKKSLHDEKTRMKLERAGIKLTQADGKTARSDSEIMQSITDAGYDDIMETLDDGDKEALKKAGEAIDYQKDTSHFQSSMLDKMQVLMDWLMNKLYNVMTGIWDTIVELWDGLPAALGGGKGAAAKMEIQIAKTKNKDMMEAFDKAKGDLGAFKGEYITKSLGPQIAEALKASQSEYDTLGTAKATEKDPKKLDAIDKRMKELVDAKQNDLSALLDILSSTQQSTLLQDKNLGLTAEQTKAIQDQVDLAAQSDQKLSLSEALLKSGVQLSKEQGDALMQKSVWTMTPEQLASLNLKMLKTTGAAPAAQQAAAAPAPGTPPPAAAPPTPGAPSVAVTAAAPPSQKPVTSEDFKSQSAENNQVTQDSLDELRRKQKQSSNGIALNGPFLKSQYGPQVEESVLNAVEQALFEYYMYSDLNRGDVVKALQRGVNGRDIGAGILSEVKKGGGTGAEALSKLGTAPANAAGGTVLNPAPGELLASVAPGETIVPAGGGGGGGVQKVVIELKGDMLKQIIRAQSMNAINEHQRATRLR